MPINIIYICIYVYMYNLYTVCKGIQGWYHGLLDGYLSYLFISSSRQIFARYPRLVAMKHAKLCQVWWGQRMKTNETVQETQAASEGGASYLSKLLYSWVKSNLSIQL